MRAILTLSIFLVASACDKTEPPQETPTKAAEPAATEEAAVIETLESKLPLHLVGSLDIPGAKIDYFARIRLDGKKLAGTLSIPQQGARDVDLAKIMLTEDTLTFRLEQADAAWTGTFKGDAIDCAFAQRGISLECSMKVVTADEYAEAADIRRPQDPKPPFPYDIEEVEYESPKARIKLAGTLTIPKGTGPHRAALLISGSGAQDRDEALMGHKPFWVIADHLSRDGIAVLRVDDRGVGGSGGDSKSATMKDFAQDVEAGVEFLSKHARVDKARIGLIGHSEGGAVGPFVAARNRGVAFVVLLAGPGVDGGEVLVEQVAALAKSLGADEAKVNESRAAQRKVMDILRATKDDAKARAAMIKVLDPQGVGGPQLDAQLDRVVSPWFRTFVSYDPAPTLKRLKIPVLALIGSLDTQVVATQNIPAIKKALSGNAKADVRTLEGLNHLFQKAKTGSPTEYGQIAQTIDPSVLEIVAGWIGGLS